MQAASATFQTLVRENFLNKNALEPTNAVLGVASRYRLQRCVG